MAVAHQYAGFGHSAVERHGLIAHGLVLEDHRNVDLPLPLRFSTKGLDSVGPPFDTAATALGVHDEITDEEHAGDRVGSAVSRPIAEPTGNAWLPSAP